MRNEVKINVETLALEIDLDWLLEQLPIEQVVHVSDLLSCREDVVKNVADQIIDGYTSECSSAARGYDYVAPSSALDVAIRRVAEASSEIAKNEIRKLSESLKYQQEQNSKYMSENIELKHQIYELKNKLREVTGQ